MKTMTSKPVLSLKNVTKIYGKPGSKSATVGIKDLSLEILQGEIFGFLGQNGAGKTTTIRCLLSILLPQKGEMFIEDQMVSRDNPEIRELIGYLPGEWSVPGNITVEDFLYYIAALKNRPSNRMQEIAERFELQLHRKVGELSKGNKQKVGLVVAFMHDPDIYILDEPTSGLDPFWQQEVYKLIREEKQRGKTTFFSSHNLDEVQKLSDRVAIIREGKLVTVEKVEDLSEKIPRILRAQIDQLSEEDVTKLGQSMKIVGYDYLTEELKVQISRPHELGIIIEKLNSLNSRLEDISYPPASLEEYFFSKYRE